MMITVSKEILFELEKKLLQQEIRIAELEVENIKMKSERRVLHNALHRYMEEK